MPSLNLANLRQAREMLSVIAVPLGQIGKRHQLVWINWVCHVSGSKDMAMIGSSASSLNAKSPTVADADFT